jgi:hypothetical protein
MKNHIKKHWFWYLILLFFIIGFPLGASGVEVNFNGALGWAVFLLYGFIVLCLFYVLIFGGISSFVPFW